MIKERDAWKSKSRVRPISEYWHIIESGIQRMGCSNSIYKKNSPGEKNTLKIIKITLPVGNVERLKKRIGDMVYIVEGTKYTLNRHQNHKQKKSQYTLFSRCTKLITFSM